MNFRCVICDSVDKWKNVDEFRTKPSNMHMCTGCGFVGYPDVEKKKLKDYYREEYRNPPTVANIYTGERKIHYHSQFLQALFKKWKEEKVTTPVVFEVGAAFGLSLDWFRKSFPKADLNGSELTTAYRRVAMHEFGIYLGEEFDYSKDYDFIWSYKVAEHQPDIDKELISYKKRLKPNGYMYISVPTWFDRMTNFGIQGWSIEYYYHKNHINVWTRKLFETMLRKCGLQVVQEDHVFYDSTYLCKRNDALMKEKPIYEDPDYILGQLKKIKMADKANEAQKYAEAINIFPFFPMAHIAQYETNRAAFHKKGRPEFIANLLKSCPDHAPATLFAADVHLRYEEWDATLKLLDKGLKEMPNSPDALIKLAHCFRSMAAKETDEKQKLKLWNEAKEATKYLRGVSRQMWSDSVNWLFDDYSRVPINKPIKGVKSDGIRSKSVG